MSPSECHTLDPQQRLLLEAIWEVASAASATTGKSLIARTRMPPQRKANVSNSRRSSVVFGSAAETGVFVGASSAEWMLLQQQHSKHLSSFSASGSGLSVLAGMCLGLAQKVCAWRRKVLYACQVGRLSSFQTAFAGRHSSFRLLPGPLLTGRISFLFGWTGPSTVTDTACSSSLVALNTAFNCLMVRLIGCV